MISLIALLIAFQVALVAIGIDMLTRGNRVGWIIVIGNVFLVGFNLAVHIGCVFGCTLW